MLKGICNLSIIPMRKTKSDKSEMINQILFGETFTILHKKKKWSFIQLDHDNYQGWIDNKQYVISKNSTYQKEICSKTFLNIKIQNKKQTLLLGSLIPRDRKISDKIDIKPKIKFDEIIKDKKYFLKIAKKYINTPYLWGGRSPLGIDCSGYTQMVFRFFGHQLPRDAYEQEEIGKKITKISDLKMGDLAFFGKNKKISHVGIVLNKKKIIHASGKVRIDLLDEKGIYQEESKLYTHILKSIKRVL